MAIIRAFARFIFSLRGAVVALLLILLLIQHRPVAWQVVDSVLLKIGAQLILPRSSLIDTALIQLSPDEMQRLQSDPVSAELVLELLASMEHSATAVTAIVLDRLPRNDWHVSERLLQSSSTDEALSYLQRRKKAMAQLQREELVLLSDTTIRALGQSQSLAVSSIEERDWYTLLPTFMQPAVRPGLNVDRGAADGLASGWLPPVSGSVSYPLVVSRGGQLQASPALLLFQRYLAASSMEWRRPRQLVIGKRVIATSVDGSLVPFYNEISGVDAPVKQLSLSQALDATPDKAIVLIGQQGDPRLRELANVLVSLQQGAYWYSPYWFFAAEKILLLLLGLYLLLLLPRLSRGVATLSSLLLVVVMVAAQLGWLVTQWQWLPLGLAVEFLLLGSLLMTVWSSRQRQWQALEMDCHQSNFQLAQQWYQQDHLKEALDAISRCRATDPVLTLAYDVAAQQERKRQYQAAGDTYRMIISRKRNFKDAAKRAKALASLKMGNSQEVSALDVSSTLVMPDANVNRPILGRYEIERELGRGAMGVVYLGYDPKISRRVAIKTLNYKQFDSSQVQSVKARFFREAEAAGRLHHPNIVTVYDVGEEPDLAFIAMDFVEGESLDKHITADTLLPVDAVYELIAQVAEALDYAHRQNIVHRDIKPGNIMYNSEDGMVKVADFGIARITDDSKTKTGDILGSPIYMSPEQLKGSKVVGATDIYSLGVTLYQLLTAEVPFNGDSIANLAYQILNKKYKSVREVRPDLPASAARIVNKAMQKDPAKRFPDAGAMAEALRKSLGRDF